MSGDGTFSGTRYQAGVIAFVYVHMLARQRLGWLDLSEDPPLAISGEVAGSGGDARIELPPGEPVIELQAKHGLRRLRGSRQDIGMYAYHSPRTAAGPVFTSVESVHAELIELADELLTYIDRIISMQSD